MKSEDGNTGSETTSEQVSSTSNSETQSEPEKTGSEETSGSEYHSQSMSYYNESSSESMSDYQTSTSETRKIVKMGNETSTSVHSVVTNSEYEANASTDTLTTSATSGEDVENTVAKNTNAENTIRASNTTAENVTANDDGIVKTGDATNIAGDLAGLGVAGGVIAGLALKKKKEKDEQK